VTSGRFWTSALLFHALLVPACWYVFSRWQRPQRREMGGGAWWRAAAREVVLLALLTYAASLLAPLAVTGGRLSRWLLGDIALRLVAQALFGEAILLSAAAALTHRRAGRRATAVVCWAAAAVLFATYVDAYHVEPRLLKLRWHRVDRARGQRGAETIRILHITDVQTPSIGAHEERALRMGLATRPQLIVFTGDYVQNEMGRRTDQKAVRDLQALIARVGFRAPLGVFATNGDAGPPCRDVFEGTDVRCLVDESAIVRLPAGGTLKVTGLSRNRGRERDPAFLARLLARGGEADHQVVISHAPDFVDVAPAGLDLVLAGHTHGGQVVLPLFGPPATAMRLPRRYAGGLNDFNGTPLHVSRGVGMERGFAVPIRFLCPPEICVLDVRLPASGPARLRVHEADAAGPGALGRVHHLDHAAVGHGSTRAHEHRVVGARGQRVGQPGPQLGHARQRAVVQAQPPLVEGDDERVARLPGGGSGGRR
jgi:uncharacterized protein